MSATKTWFGGTGDFSNPNDWSPKGVPQSGDVAIIRAGVVHASNGSLAGISLGSVRNSGFGESAENLAVCGDNGG
jgi:hypothetical protein